MSRFILKFVKWRRLLLFWIVIVNKKWMLWNRRKEFFFCELGEIEVGICI